MKPGDERYFGSKKYTLLYEHWDGVWMVCETDNPAAQPRLLHENELREEQAVKYRKDTNGPKS